MPKRTDIKSILIIGAGPIVIGQACEFDYSGTQACKALKAEGYRIILVNSNPATIMTDPDLADATYIEPITADIVAKIIEAERPDALLPTMGGQTALNTALELHRRGILDKMGVEMIGARAEAIDKAEDRRLFREAMDRIGLESPRAAIASSPPIRDAEGHIVRYDRAAGYNEAMRLMETVGLPAIIRPAFTLGGTGGGVAYNREEFEQIARSGIDASPVGQILIDESLLGWKEYEMEVVRDKADNCIIVCSIENIDPMGVHTGDSITVAPALTLTDKEYQMMRNASIAVLREIGVETGGSNVQFAVDPETGRLVVIEMNPRVSRSSALASKATGFPIAKVAARLAVGYTLDELENDITGGATPASFEPTIDYVVTKIPRFAFEKFRGADTTLTTAMKSVGEVMAIGRTFAESLQKALRSMETGLTGLDDLVFEGLGAGDDKNVIRAAVSRPTPDRILKVAQALREGFDIEQVHQSCKIDPWFLAQIQEIVDAEKRVRAHGLPQKAEQLRALKAMGFSDARLAKLAKISEVQVRQKRRALGVRPVFKRIDTCAAEFAAPTAYMYSTYERGLVLPEAGGTAKSDTTPACEAQPTDRKKVIILGGGPNRIGQGIEFDYCCCHACFSLTAAGYETIMINCNPETVSTDYDTSDRLYFEPLTAEDVLEIIATEQSKGTLHGVIVQFGGQTPLKLAEPLAAAGVPILGTSPDAIDLAEDRDRFKALIERLKLQQPQSGIAKTPGEARAVADKIGYPVVIRPSYVLGRTCHGDRARRPRDRPLRRAAIGHARQSVRARRLRQASAADRSLSHRRGRGRRRLSRRRHRHVRRGHHGAHRGGRHPFRGQRLLAAALLAGAGDDCRDRAPDAGAGACPESRRSDERAVRHQGRPGLRARGEPARVPHGTVRGQGNRQTRCRHCRRDHGRQAAVGCGSQIGAAPPCGGQGGRLPLRALPRRRSHPGTGDALHRRGHGHRSRLRHGLRQEPDRLRPESADGGYGLRLGEGFRQGPHGGPRAPAGGHGLQDHRHRAAPSGTWRPTGSPARPSTRCSRGARTSSMP